MTEKSFAKLNQKAVFLSIFSYIFLSVLKIFFGSITKSAALTADGLNNSIDILSSIAVLIGLKLSLKPPDSDHPYGHRRAETISSLIASFIMFIVGMEVLINAGTLIWKGRSQTPDWLAAWLAIIGAVIMLIVYTINKRIAQKTENLAVMATAKDNLSDALVSIGVAIGIIASHFHLAWLDSIMAFAIGGIILKTAWNIFQEASHHLSDGINEEYLQKIREELACIEGVYEVTSVKGRTHGKNLLLDIDILVNPMLTVYESHLITEQIENHLKKTFPISHIQIHVEPKLVQN